MSYCNIVPKVLNLNGDLVESKLFYELWDNSKINIESVVDARNKAIDQYKVAHSIEFINQFGDWELLKNYNLNNLSDEQSLRLIQVYNSDIKAVQSQLEGKLNELGEPKTEYILNYTPTIQQEVELSLDDVESTYDRLDSRHVNRLLSKYVIEFIQKGEPFSKQQIQIKFLDELTILQNELESIEIHETDPKVVDKLNRISQIEDNLDHSLTIHEILDSSDFIWDKFFSYFSNTYKIDISKRNVPELDEHIERIRNKTKQLRSNIKHLVLDETDSPLMVRSSSWDDGLQLHKNKEDSVANNVKFALSTISINTERSTTGLAEPIELSDVWPSMVAAHRHDRGNAKKVIETVKRLSRTLNPGLGEFVDKLESDSNLLDSYIVSIDVSMPKDRGSLIAYAQDMFEWSIQDNNRGSFVELKIYDSFIESINQEFIRGKSLHKYIEENPEFSAINPATADPHRVTNLFKDVTGISINPQAIIDFIEDDNKGNSGDYRKKLVYGYINRIIKDIYKTKQKELGEYDSGVSDVRGDIARLAEIQAPYSNIRPKLSYFSQSGNIHYTAQNHSYFTDMFAGISNSIDAYNTFYKFTLDPKYQHDNILWNTATEEQMPNGIFDYIIDSQSGLRVITGQDDVRMGFVNRISSSLYGGTKDITNGIAAEYDQILNDNWNLNVFVHSLFGSHFISSSDSGRTFQLELPRTNIFDTYRQVDKDMPFMEFDNEGNFVSLDLSQYNHIYESLANTVRQEVSEHLAAREAIFDIEDGKLVLKDKFKDEDAQLHLLRSPKHYKLDNKTGKPIIIENGIPTGRVFNFNNMSYVKDGNTIYFHDFISEKGLNPYTLERQQYDNLLPDFIGRMLENRIKEHINMFSPVKEKLFTIHKYFSKSGLSEQEITDLREENRLIKTNKDFKQQVASFLINDYLARVSIDNFVLGNQNEYADSLDRNKRVGQGIKNMIRLNRYELKNGELVERTYNSLVVHDLKARSSVLDNLKGILSENTIDRYVDLIDQSDGFTIIREAEFVKRLKAAGRYDLYKGLIEDINNRDIPFDATKYNNLIESQKFFMYSRDLDTSLYPQMVSTQHKNSTFVLFDRFVEGTQLKDLSDFMNKTSTDQIIFNSAAKVSGVLPVTITDKDGNFVRPTKKLTDNYKQTLHYGDLGIQVDTRSHILDERIKLGVQISRLITNGLVLDGKYRVNGKDITGQQLFEEYHEILSDNIQQSANELLSEWGALDENGEIRQDPVGNIIVEESKVFEYIKEQSGRDTQNENILRSVSDNMVRGIPNMPLYASINYKKFLSVLFAKIRNKITDQEMPGIHANLVPDIFLGRSKDFINSSKVDFNSAIANKHITFIDRINEEVKTGKRKDYNLQTITKEIDGQQAIVAEVILNPWMKSMFKDGQVIDINKLSEEERTMLGIRIPTEDKPSMFVIEVVGFMNSGASQAIFPSDYITKTGWDFDLDSVFIYRKNVKPTKEGSFEVLKYTEDKANLRNRYNAFIYEKLGKQQIDNAIAQEVIDQTILDSQEEFERYLDTVHNLPDFRTKTVESIIFDEVNNLDNTQFTKQFKIIAANLNKKGIRNPLERTSMYQEYVREELFYLDEKITEYDSMDQVNIYLENRNEMFLHMNNVLNDLMERYIASQEIAVEAKQEMQDNQHKMWDNLKDTIVDSYVQEYNLTPLSEFKNYSISTQNTRKARQNQILNIFTSILSNKAHYDQLMRPNTFDLITEVGNYVNELWGKNLSNLNTNYFVDEATLRNINISTRDLKGNSVALDSLMSILGVTGARIKDKSGIYHAIPISELGEKFKNKTEEQIKVELAKYYDVTDIGANVSIKDGVVYIQDHRLANNPNKTWTDIYDIEIQSQTSEVTANILDAVKALMGFNINNHTLSVFKLLSYQPTTYIHNGKANRFAFAYMFTHQPILVDLVNEYSREETMANVPSMFYVINNIRTENLSKLFNILKPEFNTVLKDSKHLANWNKQAANNSLFIDKPSNKKGNYKVFYKALNNIMDKHGLSYDMETEKYYHTVKELEGDIKLFKELENKDINNLTPEEKIKYAQLLTRQLRVLNSFHTYYALGNKLVNLATALKFDKADTPTFADSTKLFNSLNNVILSYAELREALDNSAVNEQSKEEILDRFKKIVNPEEKIKYINEKIEYFKGHNINIHLPFNMFQIDGTSLTESIFPSLYGLDSKSSYPMMESYFQNNVMLAKKMFSNLFLFEASSIGKEGVIGYGPLKNQILTNNNLLGKGTTENIINDYILAWATRDIPFFQIHKGEELSVNFTAEVGRLLNTQNKAMSPGKFTDFTIEEFRQLSLPEKISILKESQADIIDKRYPEAHILNLIEVRNRIVDFEENGYHYIIFKDAEVDHNLTTQSILEMYNSPNEILRDVAQDLVKYAYIMHGLTFGNNISRVIPVETLYDNRLNEHIDPSESPGIYSDRLRQELNRVLSGEFSETGFTQALHQAKWNNRQLNPLGRAKIYISRNGNKLLDNSHPTWQINSFEYGDKEMNLIVEPREFVERSKYANKDYVLIDKGEKKVLYKKYDDGSNSIIYHPINRTLPFEFGETAIEAYKEGIYSEKEYRNFINHAREKSLFSEILTERRKEGIRKSILKKGEKIKSGIKSDGIITIDSLDVLSQLPTGSVKLITNSKKYEPGVYNVEDFNGLQEDFGVKINYIGEAKLLGETVYIDTDGYTKEEFAKLNGYNNIDNFIEANKQFDLLFKGKRSMHVYDIDSVVSIDPMLELEVESETASQDTLIEAEIKKETKKDIKQPEVISPTQTKINFDSATAINPNNIPEVKYNIPEQTRDFSFMNVHGVAFMYINGEILRHFLNQKNEARAKDMVNELNNVLDKKDNNLAIEYIERFSNRDLSSFYSEAYVELARENENLREALGNINEDIIADWGVSEALNKSINNGIKDASTRVKNTQYEVALVNEIIENNNSLSETSNSLSRESDYSVYIHDSSTNMTDKLVKSNMVNPINVDITKDITSEVDKLVSKLPKDKSVTLFMTGDDYSSIKYNKKQVDRYIKKFMTLLHLKYPKIYNIKSLVKDGISNSLNDNNVLPITFFETTGGREGYIFASIPPSQREVALTEHQTEPERDGIKLLEERNALDKQKEAILSSIENAKRLIKSLQIGVSDPTISTIEDTIKPIATKETVDAIMNYEISSFTSALISQVDTALYIEDRLNNIMKYLEDLTPNDLFNSFTDSSSRAIFNRNIKFALDLTNSLDFVDELQSLEGTKESIPEFEGMDSETIKVHDAQVNKLKEINNRIDSLRDRLSAIKDRYIHAMVMHWTKNPKFKESAFQYARLNKIKDYDKISVDEIQNDLEELFKNNEDLSWIMMQTDSVFDTGITLIDATMKEYFSSRGAKDREVVVRMDKFEDTLADYLGLIGNDRYKVGSNLKIFKQKREELFRKFVNRKTGDLHAEYNWTEYGINYSLHMDNIRDMYHELQKLNDLYDETGDESYLDKSSELAQEIHNTKVAWNKENMNRSEEVIILTEKEKQTLDSVKNQLKNEADYRRYLYSRHYLLENYETNEVNKLVPSDKYKSQEFANLSSKDLTFLNELKAQINDVMKNVYVNYITPDTFLPVSVRTSTKDALKQLFGIRDVKQLEFYVGLNDDLVYQIKTPMLNMVNKYHSYNIRDNRLNETPEQWEKNVVNEINELRVKTDQPKFTSIRDIKKSNRETLRQNIEYTASIRNYDPAVVMRQFINQSYNYKHIRDFEKFYKIMLMELGSDRFQTYKEGKGRFKNMVDKLKTGLRNEPNYITNSGKDTRAYQRYRSWYETFSGQSKITDRYDQVLGVIKQYTSMVYMGFNVYGGIKNVTKGMHDMVMEAMSEEFIEREHLSWGITAYPYMDLLRTIGQDRVHNLETGIIKRHFNMLELKNEKGIEYSDADKDAHRILMLHDAAYFSNRITEHFMQYTMLLAATKSHRIVGNRFMSFQEFLGEKRKELLKGIISKDRLDNLNEYQEKQLKKKENVASDQDVTTEWVRRNLTVEEMRQLADRMKKDRAEHKKQFDTHETVYDQYKLIDGRAKLKEGSAINDEQLDEFERRVHKINHQLHGIYNIIDQNRLKQSMLGDLLLQFRSWMRPNWNRYFGSRMGRTRFDEGLGTWQKGAYVSLWDYLTIPKKDNRIFLNRKDNITPVEAFKNLLGDYGKLIRNFKVYYNILPEYERANIRRALTNLIEVAALTATLALLGKLAADFKEDDEEIFMLAFAIYELNMVHSEMSQFIPGPGTFAMISRTKQSIAPAESVIRDSWNLITTLTAYPFRDEDERIYQQGVYRGQSKLQVAFRKNTPLIRQYHKHLNIPTFTGWYKLHNPFSGIF